MADSRVELHPAAPGDAGTMVAVLVEAFDADPFFGWMFDRDTSGFGDRLREWLHLVVGFALPRGQGWLDHQDEGTAIWLPPGAALVGPDELVAAARLLDELVGNRASEVLGAIASGGSGVPNVPHWLCLYIGVRPNAQGRGLGRELLRRGLDAADHDGAPAHLVATNPATAPFYERFGFRILGDVVASTGVPALRPMWRDGDERDRSAQPGTLR